MITIKGITVNDLPIVWEEAKALLQMAINHQNELNIDDVFTKISEKDMQLFCVFSGEMMVAAVTTEMFEEKDKRLNITLCGGINIQEWIEHIGTLENWAKSQGCKRITIMGRKGWEKMLQPYGFSVQYVAISRYI